MEIKTIPKYKLVLVKIEGEIDDHVSKKIRNAIDGKILSSGAVNVAFDLSDVRFMDSSGIGIIMGRYKKVSSMGGQVIVFGMRASVKRLLQIASLGSIVVMADTLEEGIEEVC